MFFQQLHLTKSRQAAPRHHTTFTILLLPVGPSPPATQSNFATQASVHLSMSSVSQDTALRPDTNRFIPPKPGGSSTDAPDSGSSLAEISPTLTVTLLLGGGGDSTSGGSTVSMTAFDFRSDRNIAVKHPQNQVLFRPPPLLDFSTEFDDLRRFLLDRTLPIHETFGDEGSDFPIDWDRFGNSRMLAGLYFLRFGVSA